MVIGEWPLWFSYPWLTKHQVLTYQTLGYSAWDIFILIIHIIFIALVNKIGHQLLESLHHMNVPLFHIWHIPVFSHLDFQLSKTLKQWFMYKFFLFTPEQNLNLCCRLQLKHSKERTMADPLSNSSTTEMVSLTLNLTLCIKKSIKQLKVCP